jgi:hypothetical protein
MFNTSGIGGGLSPRRLERVDDGPTLIAVGDHLLA